MLKVKKLLIMTSLFYHPYYITLKFELVQVFYFNFHTFLDKTITLIYFKILVKLKNNKIGMEGVSRAT